jgi:hypothetical protein
MPPVVLNMHVECCGAFFSQSNDKDYKWIIRDYIRVLNET